MKIARGFSLAFCFILTALLAQGHHYDGTPNSVPDCLFLMLAIFVNAMGYALSAEGK